MSNEQFPISNKCPISNSRSGKYDIYDRCFGFAVKTAELIDKLPKTRSAYEYGKQLIRSSASVGANMEEADGAVSKRDFTNKLSIARKEVKESRYWLRLIQRTLNMSSPELECLLRESEEIKLIISSIINKTKSKERTDH
jgi:four helix bundle protein